MSFDTPTIAGMASMAGLYQRKRRPVFGSGTRQSRHLLIEHEKKVRKRKMKRRAQRDRWEQRRRELGTQIFIAGAQSRFDDVAKLRSELREHLRNHPWEQR